MNDALGVPGVYRFGVFEFDGQTLELTKNGRSVAARPQPLKLLALLLAKPGELVSRDELQRTLWESDTFVDFDQGVNHAISELRTALSDTAESPRYIQTLPRRGYRFIAPVDRVSPRTILSTPSAVVSGESFPLMNPSSHREEAPSRVGRRLTTAAIVVLAIGITGLAYLGRRIGADNVIPSGALTLAVRSFTVPVNPALGIGLADAISMRLAGQRAATVWSDPTVLSARDDRNEDAATPWPSGATHTLEGAVAINGAHMDVLVRLRDRSGRMMWSDRIQVQSADLFDVEAVIAERVVSALRLQIAAAEQARLRRRYTRNGPAFAHYLSGRASLVTYTREGTLAAIRAFEEALRHDAAYTLARAGLAMASAEMYLRFAEATEAERWGERAEVEARAALDLDSELAEAHLARAAVARKREFDWNATITSGRRALALNPNLDQARFFVAGAYYHNGYMQEALIEMEKGRRLHGVDVIEPIRIEALVALFSGNFAPALTHLQQVSRLSSQPIGDTYLALAYYYTGNVARARTMLEALASHASVSTAARAGAALAAIIAAQGDHQPARQLLNRIVTGDYRDHHVAYSVGAAYAQLGDAGASLQWLRTAADTGFACAPFFERDPLLEPLRRHSTFTELLEYVRTRRVSALQ
jgi:DNA-binding winged helix-turn-helix (wHTH) protein/tetratricopeptide (TPR) repeat protein